MFFEIKCFIIKKGERSNALSLKKVCKTIVKNGVEKRKKHNQVETRSRSFRKSLIEKINLRLSTTFDEFSDDEMETKTIEEVLDESLLSIESIIRNFKITDLNEAISNTIKSPNLINRTNFTNCNNNNNNNNKKNSKNIN
ncbi:hypothetical protein RB653_009235 [Dictyostelium firmibasis]|uniref:Uncharacterized protein n=1 Tax=Dictyostelium firmibasis TaxID=79012 RepID=A0AAN7U1N4_9MYCE